MSSPVIDPRPTPKPTTEPKIMVHVVAYNAVSTLASTLDRIPKHLRERISEICIFDDASADATFLVGEGYRSVRGFANLKVFRNPKNLGYGGNQKVGYRYAIDNGFDCVVLLHGDGQYAPEYMENLLAPLLDGTADAVFGSRMMTKGGARRGGMPLYKYVGNRILSGLENAALGMELTEFHSGYRAYRVDALRTIPFEANTNDFHFDTQIIIQLRAAGYVIHEVPIPTYYGDEICHVNGMKYARDVLRSVFEYRQHKSGLKTRPEYAHVPRPRYEGKESPFASHHRIVEAVKPGARVLDVGCGTGAIATALKAKGCTVVGVDREANDECLRICDRFYVADLEQPWSPAEGDFDYVLFADVLEHLRNVDILARAKAWLRPGGRIIASTSNIALWYMRLQLLLGRFDYTPRGILDETHVRLYNRESFKSLFTQAGLHVLSEDFTVIPLERFVEPMSPSFVKRAMFWVEQASYQFARFWPEAGAYQFVLVTEPESKPIASTPSRRKWN